MGEPLRPLDEGFERALCIAAHPDDLEYGLASVVARWTAQGKVVGYVMVTSGEAGIDGLAPAECGPLREDEERRSAAVVGVEDVAFLRLPDGLLEANLELRRALAGAIRRFRPDVVLTLSHELVWFGGAVNHADHRAVGVATYDACRDAANRWVWPDLGEPCPPVQAVYIAPAEPATHFVDVGDSLHLGIRSLEEHRAYIDGLGTGFDPAAFLRGNAEEGGRQAGVPLAVTLRRLGI